MRIQSPKSKIQSLTLALVLLAGAQTHDARRSTLDARRSELRHSSLITLQSSLALPPSLSSRPEGRSHNLPAFPPHVNLWRNLNPRERLPIGVHQRSSAVPRILSPTAVDSIIKQDYLMNDDRIGGGRQGMPQLDFLPDGRVALAWEDFRNGDNDAMTQRLDTNAARIGVNIRACDDGDMWWQGEPCVGAGLDGSYLVAWEDRRHGGSDVLVQRYDPSGAPVDTNYQINDPTYTDQRASAITTLPDGRFVVAWEDWRNDIGDIYAVILDAGGRPVSANFRVNSPPDWQQYGAAIASDDSGNFTITWESGITGWDIYAQRYNSRGETLGPNFMVNNDPNRNRMQWGPAVACARNGTTLIAFEDHREDTLTTDVYAQFYNPDGSLLGTNFRVNDSLAGRSHYSPSVAVDAQGNFLVAFIDTRDGRGAVYAQAYDPAGSRIGGNFRINDDVGHDHGDVMVKFSPRGEYWVTWTDYREGNADIYAQRLDAGRNAIGANFRVNDDSFSTQQRVSTVAANEHGHNITIWEDERNGNCDVYAQICDSAGNAVGGNLKCNTDNVGAAHFYATAAIDRFGNSMTAWTDGRNGYQIYAQAFDASGSRLGGNVRVNDAGEFHWSPCAAKDSAGNSLIVFMDTRLGAFKIYGQRYNAANQAVGANFRISDTIGGWHQYPSVAMAPDGWFVAVWMEERPGNVYGQIYGPDGNPVGTNFAIPNDSASTYKGYPCVACDAQGNFCAVWEDYRDTNHVVVYAQRFDRQGNRLGRNFRVDDYPYIDQYSPSNTYDDQGRMVVVWTDGRDIRWNPQVYARRFDAAGNPVGRSQLVHRPDLFYYNHHWTMQRSVAFGANRLFFSWIENRRHQGWDIYNKVTDWSLMAVSEEQPVAARPRLALAPVANPVAYPTQLRLTVPPQQPAQVVLYSITGRRVLDLYAGTPATANLDLKLNPAHLNTGAYFLIAKSGSQTERRKLIIQEAK